MVQKERGNESDKAPRSSLQATGGPVLAVPPEGHKVNIEQRISNIQL